MTLARERLQALFDHPNIRAFYAVVRRGESSLDDHAYRMVNGGPDITDFSRHPYAGLSTKVGGRAAGAPQFIPSTWAEIAERYSLPDFSPESQDLGYVGCLLKRPGAIEALLAGKFEAAVRICRPEWTSLPGAAENNPAWNMDKARALYLDRGGRLDNEELLQPAAPIEERDLSGIPPRVEPEATMPEESPSFDWSMLAKAGGAIASIFNPAVGLAITALSPLLQEKITKTVGKHTDDPKVAAEIGKSLTEAVMTTTKAVTGKADELEAVAVMRRDPAMIAKVEQAVTAKLDELAPYLDKLHAISKEEWAAEAADRAAASERAKNDTMDMAGPLLYSAIGGVGVLTLFVGIVIVVQLATTESVGNEMWAALTGLIGWITAKAGTIYDYRFGSSRASGAKDVLISELSRRQ
jgi:muramidase (phage lysozyme)